MGDHGQRKNRVGNWHAADQLSIFYVFAPERHQNRIEPADLAHPQQMSGITSVPTLVEQSQLVGVGDGDFLMQIIMKQAIDGGFLEQAEAQNL